MRRTWRIGKPSHLRLISLIQAVTIIRHAHRERDDQGRYIAEVSDYSTTYDLVKDMYIDTVSGVTPSVTEVVEAVADLKATDPGLKVGYAALERKLGIHKQQVTRNVSKAISRGWLVDREIRPRSPRDIEVGEPIPDDEGLPSPDTIRHAVTGLTNRGEANY